MKGNIRNRKTVAAVMTKTNCGAFGLNPCATFIQRLGSRALYHNAEKLVINAQNKKDPQASFSRVKLGEGAFIWVPTNSAGENYLASLNEIERNEFLYHVQPDRAKPVPESRRVVDSRPIKGLPNGHREADYFDADDGTPRRSRSALAKRPAATKYVKEEPEPRELTEEEVAQIRADISSGKF